MGISSGTLNSLNTYLRHWWLAERIRGKQLGLLAFFDLKKAFDSVPHRALIEKLSSLGLNSYLLKRDLWLSYRTSSMCSCYICISPSIVWSTPRLSPWPLLFLIYIDDVAHLQLNAGSTDSVRWWYPFVQTYQNLNTTFSVYRRTSSESSIGPDNGT